MPTSSMLPILGFLFYSGLFIFLLHRFTRHTPVRLTAGEITLAFGCKVLAGCLYGYIFLHYFGGDDTWHFHKESMDEYEELFRDPALFFSDFSPVPSFAGAGSFIDGCGLYIMNLEKQLLFKTLALFNFFSRGNYYINVVFFNFIVFWGHYWLFSLLVKEFAEKRKWLFLIIFFFPPVIFWLSGIRADGLLFFFISLCLLHFHRWVQQYNNRSLVICLVALAGVLIFRHVLVMLVIPAFIAWFIAVRGRRNPLPAFVTVYIISCTLFFGTALFSSSAGLPGIVAKRQQEFFLLKGNTRLPLDTLQPSFGSYLQVAPQAAHNTFLRPYPWEARGMLQVMASADVLFFWLLVALAVFKRDALWKQQLAKPVLLFFVFFGISLYLLIGYTIPFPGAIVRYKITGELFLLIVLILTIRWRDEPRIIKKVHI